MDTRQTHIARMRIQIEYIEMPNLKLTLAQVRRLCDLSTDACEAALTSLVVSGFLTRARDGSFLRQELHRRIGAAIACGDAVM